MPSITRPPFHVTVWFHTATLCWGGGVQSQRPGLESSLTGLQRGAAEGASAAVRMLSWPGLGFVHMRVPDRCSETMRADWMPLR